MKNNLGTAGPLSLVEGLDDTFLVTNGDVLATLDIKELVDFHKRHQGIATIACHQRKVMIDFGVLQTGPTCEITEYIEKPVYELLVSMGIYVFEPAVLSYIPYNEYLDFPDLVLKMLAAGERVISYPYHGYWMDLGRLSDYEQAIQDFETMKAQFIGDEAALKPAPEEKINHV